MSDWMPVSTVGTQQTIAVSATRESTVHLTTFGCQMNEYDSELVRSILIRAGYRFTEQLEQAGVVLLNTCAIRERAHQTVYRVLDQLRWRKRGGEQLLVGLLGCMTTNLRERLLLERPEIDLVAGPDSYRRLPQLLRRARSQGLRGSDLSLSEYETYEQVYPRRAAGVNAWIAVMRGCDNFCSFCVVPYTRGRERSRDPDGVVEEVSRLAAEGFRQVTLLGQNVNSYRYGAVDFAELLLRVAAVDGIRRIRFTSPHPKDFPPRLLEALASCPKLCKQVHLPLQAGSDAVLERMKRTYTQSEYLALVERIRSLVPEVKLSTDILVGFAGESEEDFQATLRVVEQVGFDSAFTFQYSERVGTYAARHLPDDVPAAVKGERLQRLIALQRGISQRLNRAEIGRLEEILVEGPSKRSSAEWVGRTDGNKVVIFPHAGERPGDLIRCRIVQASSAALQGEKIA
jgi:tRNA-2-methylthio-N6-dimethylallyladenosine synthase